jgi:hypothetical protein
MSDASQGPGWWQASDGKWYPSELHPENQSAPFPATEGGDSEEEQGEGEFGDGVAKPLYEFRASRFKGGRMFTPNVIRVWPDRIEEYQHHAIRKKGTQAINFNRVGKVTLGRGLRWADIAVESTGGHVISLKGVPKADGDRVKGIIDTAVHDAGEAANRPEASAAPAAQVSVADELMKLAQLRDAGVLSPEEFEVQKARVIQPPS